MIDCLMRSLGLEPEGDKLRRAIIRRENEWGNAAWNAVRNIDELRAALDGRDAEITRLRGLLAVAIAEMERADDAVTGESAVDRRVVEVLRRELGAKG